MKKVSILATISILFCLNGLAQSWQAQSNFSGPARLAGEGVSQNGKGYLFFGVDRTTNPFSYRNDVWEYDPINDSWALKTTAPFTGRSAGIIIDNDSCIITGLGWNGSSTFYDLYRYTPNTNQWDTLAPYPGNGGRNAFYAGYKNKVYVGGGGHNTNQPYEKDFWEFNITTNTWNALGDLPFGNRVVGVCFTIDSLIYFGMGHNGSRDFSDLWAYNTITSTWSQKATMPGVGRIGSSYFVLNGKAVIGGGHRFSSNGSFLNSDYHEYDPTTDTWSNFSNSFTDSARTLGTAFVINNEAFLFGGASSYPIPINDFWKYGGISVSISEIKQDEAVGLSFYPNPTNGEINIISNNNFIDGTLTILSSVGQIVFEKQFNKINGPASIDLSNLENANYYYRFLTSDSKMISGSIIKVD